MRLALTHCPDALIRQLASSLSTEGVAFTTLPPRGPANPDGEGPAWDAIVTTGSSTRTDHIRRLRRTYRDIPVVVVVDRDDSQAVVESFDAGADIVLKGPPDGAELRLRLETLVRPERTSSSRFRYGGLLLDRLRHAAEGPEGPAALTPREYQIIQYLMSRPEQVVTRDELRRTVWWDESSPSDNLLDVHVSNLRRKLEATGVGVELVHTVRGVGFMFGSPGSSDGRGGNGSRRSAPDTPCSDGRPPVTRSRSST